MAAVMAQDEQGPHHRALGQRVRRQRQPPGQRPAGRATWERERAERKKGTGKENEKEKEKEKKRNKKERNKKEETVVAVSRVAEQARDWMVCAPAKQHPRTNHMGRQRQGV